ncbi:MAG: ParB N-terminal domain-containing protein [Opitutaceae bacterium]|tara:strand:- start:2759 stop:3655 length:897 start_codon:yes stop_codon:yes gene_type:complete
MMPPSERQTISLTLIDIYGGTQTRVATNDDAIESYAEEMMQGAEFPAITLYYDGTKYWLADGFHRLLAIKRNGGNSIEADVQPGSRSDALKHALGANATNGLYRTNADKRNVADIALREWPDLSNAYLADVCKVSGELVRKIRTELTESGQIAKAERVTGRDGKEYPVGVDRQARGKSENSSSDEKVGERDEDLGGSSGKAAGGGGFSPGKGDPGATGGSTNELELEARSMIRKGEMNPFELPKLMSATAHDYAATVVTLLDGMKPEIKNRTDGLMRLRRWIDKALAGENAPNSLDDV